MRISVDEARGFFAHKSQRVLGMDPDDMHDDGIEYWASGPICVAFHRSFWPGVWMAHYGVKPEGWGQLVDPALTILSEFWDEVQPVRITGWTEEKNRQAVSFSRRLGFVEDGRMDLPTGTIIMQGWTKCH